jgi:hypothetical protein
VSSSDRSAPASRRDFDLERDLPTTPEDVAIQRRLRRRQRLSPEEFAAFLETLGSRPYEELRSRRGPRGEPFTLDVMDPARDEDRRDERLGELPLRGTVSDEDASAVRDEIERLRSGWRTP